VLFVSAVVVNFNGGSKVLRCLDALQGSEIPFGEVIVVDSASQDGGVDDIRAQYPQARLITLGDNRGPGVARNVGLKEALGELVFLIDHDIYASGECLGHLLMARQHDLVEVIVPRILTLPEMDLIQADGGDAHFVGTIGLRHGWQRLSKVERCRRQRVNACVSGCLLVDRRATLAVGGFDDDYFFYLEDLEFGLRMRSFGCQILWEPDAVVFHDLADGTPSLAYRGHGSYPERRAYLLMRNRLRLLVTHCHLQTLLVLSPALLLYEIVSLIFAATRGQVRQWLRAWMWLVTHAAELSKRRRWIQERRVLDDRYLFTAGALPVARGLLQSSTERWLASKLSWILTSYWSLARNWIR
jgi:GT2 family glycosyltransferase